MYPRAPTLDLGGHVRSVAAAGLIALVALAGCVGSAPASSSATPSAVLGSASAPVPSRDPVPVANELWPPWDFSIT